MLTPAFSAEHSPLELGATLIQASAGTGKTYTITALFLRLLLEGGLEVREILVTTYTEAATAELRERIRERLIKAADGFAKGVSDDPVIAALIERVEHDRARRLLVRAMRELDQAAVVTIHSFCQRVLRERAFESGQLFDVELVTDNQPLLQQVTQDFWRLHLAHASPVLAAAIAASKITPDSLLELLNATAHRPFIELDPHQPKGSFAALQQDCEALFTELCACWAASRTEVRGSLLTTPPWAKANNNVGKPFHVEQWLTILDEYLKPEGGMIRDLSFLEKLTPAALKKAALAKSAPPNHPFFDLCERWVTLMQKAPIVARAHCVTWTREELQRRKVQQNILHFDDLLMRLHTALHAQTGDVLTGLLRERFRAALIDEFQDTDQVQEAIFRRIFGGTNSWLYLIGDPKQAIYGFRGADVFTYLGAAAAAQRHYTLGTNWRSERLLVDGVSALFRRNARAFLEEGIHLDDVTAAGQRDQTPLRVNGRGEPPLKIWTWDHPEPLSKGLALETLPDIVASAIAQLLDSGATIGDSPLRADQIAVLVARHREARDVQAALHAVGLPSVLISDQSVWRTHEARELHTILAAIGEPWREPLVRASLATELLGFSAPELEGLAEAEAAWEARIARFSHYHLLWSQYGFIQMFRTLLRDEKVRTRLLAFTDGDRRLTNVLHLAELLQRAAMDLRLRPAAALRWFAEQRARPANGADEATVLRLERDDEAVQIITMHRSKGLQFEVVFCPFLWAGLETKSNSKTVLFHSPAARHLTLALDDRDATARKDFILRERLAENVRLTYVALTRAMHQCHLFWGRFAKQEISGPAWLLHGADKESDELPEALRTRMKTLSAEQFEADLDQLCAGAPGMIERRTVDPECSAPVRTSRPPKVAGAQSLRPFRGQIDRSWRVSSFSSLIEGAYSELPDYDARRASGSAGASDAAQGGIHQFPAGARPGVFFHAVLENLDFTDLTNLSGLVTRQLRVASLSPDRWAEIVADCLRKVISVPLSAGFSLGQIAPRACLRELEFYLPVERLERTALRGLLENEELERLHFDPCRGWLKGFIDLVFQHGDRFYIVDWKSNHLGEAETAYEQAGLALSMASHHYTLQLRLYTVALHRYLTLRLPGYDYDRHFGGAYYVFLRGVDPAHPERGIYFERPDKDRIIDFSHTLGAVS